MSTYKTTFVCLFVSLFFVITEARNQTLQTFNTFPLSVYAFGDSFVDTGNNNFINDAPKSNFHPYGRDFTNGIATGRFSNGLLFPDILAQHVGAGEYMDAYLDPTLDRKLNESVAAISFGSATSGYDVLTTQMSKAIPMSNQLEYFREYVVKLKEAKGEKKAKKQIKNAIFYINAGSFDFALAFLFGGRNRATLEEFADQILNYGKQFLEGLIAQGARKIAVTGLPPLGCIPIGITTFHIQSLKIFPAKRRCIQAANDFSSDFNIKLLTQLEGLANVSRTKTKIVFIDFQSPLLEIIQNPRDYGFKKVNRGCCGTGLLEIGMFCNPSTPVCSKASEYVFFDASNPTERTNRFLFWSNIKSISQLIQT